MSEYLNFTSVTDSQSNFRGASDFSMSRIVKGWFDDNTIFIPKINPAP